jgi:hypothetical protein
MILQLAEFPARSWSNAVTDNKLREGLDPEHIFEGRRPKKKSLVAFRTQVLLIQITPFGVNYSTSA